MSDYTNRPVQSPVQGSVQTPVQPPYPRDAAPARPSIVVQRAAPSGAGTALVVLAVFAVVALLAWGILGNDGTFFGPTPTVAPSPSVGVDPVVVAPAPGAVAPVAPTATVPTGN